MALTEQIVTDKIEVLEDGQIQIRQATRVLRDGVEIARTYHREVLDPGVDEKRVHPDPRVQSIVSVVWTPDVVAARKKAILSQGSPQGQAAETLVPASALPSAPPIKTPV